MLRQMKGCVKNLEHPKPNVEDEIIDNIKYKKVTTYDDIVFYVDNDCNIYSKNLTLLTQKKNNKGYLMVSCRTNDSCKLTHRFVHRILAQAFFRSDLDGRYEVHHKDHNPLNNSLDNLEPMLRYEHKIEHLQIYPLTKKCKICGKEFTPHKTKRKRAIVCSEKCKRKLDGINAKQRKKPINQYDLNKNFIKNWDSGATVQKELGYRHSNIVKCCKHQIDTAYGYIWEYESE